jgi:hypothetical protein
MEKMYQSGMGKVSVVVLTALITCVLTVGAGAYAIVYFGKERVVEEVSPFIENAQRRVTEGVVPPSERKEPATEADLIMEAVASTQGASVLIYRVGEGVAEETFVARGLLVSTDGIIVTDMEALSKNATYTVAVPGVKERLVVEKRALYGEALAVLSVTYASTLLPKFTDTGLENEQLVVAITGDKNQRIATGIVTESLEESVRTNLVGTITPGSVLVSKEGYTVGVSTVHAQGGGQASFTPLTTESIRAIKDFMSKSDVIEEEL